MKRLVRWTLTAAAGFVLLLVLVVMASGLSNIGLPTESEVVETLSETEKAYLAELFHLRETLGSDAFPAWGQAEIPVIVYNEAYAFLVGYPDEPEDGWVEVPQNERHGGAWEVTPGDEFQGQPYYRQRLPASGATPENFTVRVGDRWVATMQTREYAKVAFFSGFRDEVPGFLRSFVPYRLLWRVMMGQAEVYVGGLAHESFHAYQGMTVPQRLTEAESVAHREDEYPWKDEAVKDDWQEELNLLHQAVVAESEGEAADLARQFLARRASRRSADGFAYTLVDYERQREWLEGIAKYVELTLLRQAADTPEYEPLAEASDAQAFGDYGGIERFWSQQLDEVKRMGSREGETRFYYSGFAQGVLLDRLMPGWKDRLWEENVWLEDLLAEAVGFDE